MGFEEEDAMVEALPDADWGPAASVAVVTIAQRLLRASALSEGKKKKKGEWSTSVSRGYVPGENVPRMGVEPMTLASLNEEC